MSVIIIINYFSSGVFGESEFWFALIKVVTVLAFIILGLAMIFGIMNGHSSGFSNWTLVSDSGESAPFVNGWFGILAVFMVAGFSFQGTELVAVAAGEAKILKKYTKSDKCDILLNLLFTFCDRDNRNFSSVH